MLRPSGIIARLFLKARGGSGPDLSRGPLSDRIRETALSLLSDRHDAWSLEVGVGEGLLAESMVSWGKTARMIGLDMSLTNLKAAAKRLGGSRSLLVVCARGDLPPFKSALFSRVVCINTLHNQPSWEEAAAVIRAMCGLVGRGGSLLFDIRNGHDPLIRWAYRFSTVIDPSTKRLPVLAYSLSRVEELLKDSGFRVSRKAPVRYPFWPVPSAYVIEAVR